MEPTELRCRICAGALRAPFAAREMMYGTRATFEYAECTRCGCVQILQPPANLGDHYPRTYYSFQRVDRRTLSLTRAAALRVLFSKSAAAARVRRMLESRLRRLQLVGMVHALVDGRRDAAILDVGAGSGTFVAMLRDLGYTHSIGIDPYLAANVVDHRGLLVKNVELAEVSGEFRVISFHHSLEHVPDQLGTLAHARRLVAPGGTIVVRIPVVDSDAWRSYGANWVQLDAPRHLYLHTRASLAIVARDAGLRIAWMACDSDELQYWGSELYRRDVPLNDPAVVERGARAYFSRQQLREFRRRAKDANAAGRGDQIVAYLRP